jgi:hypothetical protein
MVTTTGLVFGILLSTKRGHQLLFPKLGEILVG